MHRLWMIFAQTVTVSVAILFVVTTLRPDWLGERKAPPAITIQEAVAPGVASPTKAPSSYAEAARAALPSVVHIFTSKEVKTQRHPFADDPLFRHFFGDRLDNRPQQRASGLGSGVIVSPAGYILTNNHVIEGSDDIEVALNDGRKLSARIVGRDPESDLAVLQVKSDGKLPAITFGHPDQLRVGTSCSRSAIPLASARPSRWESCPPSGAPTLASTPSKTSSRPTPRSTRATPAAP